ncbi:tetratricopeptide repeat protein [Pelolinea submarina]|uniref:Tetratricopeptide repeat protein n=1 Tax=Pelolinea submarina TaxID=913107 RepID=A0A3E0AGN6_9CHLR|nr:tetratricopeptide repeat protein [Pelolinea submarina]REG10825.1 tetratricopeptide repeat protein [Pelolinea submarina]
MGSSDPIYVFKQHFSRNDAEAVVSGLIHHRVIWNRLSDDGFLENLLGLLPAQKENWSAAHVCLAAVGIKATDASQIQPQPLPQNIKRLFDLQLEQIAPVAAGIRSNLPADGNWSAYLQKIGLDQLSLEDIQEGWGTVFTLVYYLTDNKDSFIQEFARSDKSSSQDLLAFILCANPILMESALSSVEKAAVASDLPDLLQLLKRMDMYESKSLLQHIVDNYLEKKPVDDLAAVVSKESFNNGEDLLRNIDLFRNYAILASYGSQKELADDFSKRALRSSDQLNQMLTALNNAIKSPVKNEVDLSGSFALSSDKGLVGKVLQAAQIKDSDPDSARKIGRQIHHDIYTSRGIGQLLDGENIGRVVSPVQLVRLLWDINLIREAAQTADRLIEYQPLNAELLRCAATLYSDYGDFQKSAQLYSRLELLVELTREEKLKLIEALENTSQWPSALVIWKRVNLVSLDDYEKKAICCYRSGDARCFDETVKGAKNFYTSEGLFQVLETLFEINKGQSEFAQNLIEAFLKNRKRDRYSIYFLIEYYQKTGQFGEAFKVIQSLSSLELNLPEIYVKRYELAAQSGNREQVLHVLQQAAADAHLDDLPSIEKMLAACFEARAWDLAAEMLQRTADKWILAPQLTALKAQLLNEQGKHWLAGELLEPLVMRKEVTETWLTQYGLALMESSQADFPLNISKSIPIDNRLKNIFDGFPRNLLLQVIRAEMDSENRLSHYQELLNDKDNHLDPEIWRVHAGLGKYYFEHGQFDLAVVNFKEAAKAQQQNKLLNVMLLKSLGKLSLYDEAMAVFTNMLGKGDLEIADMLEINASLKRSDQWLLNLEKFAEVQPDTPMLQAALAQLYAEKGDQKRVQESIRKSGLAGSNTGSERLVCAQILLQAGLDDEARRQLEGFLSRKQALSDSEYLSGALLYLQIGEIRKAANLLNLIERANSAILALKAELFSQLNQPQDALAAIQLALEVLESPAISLDSVQALCGIQAPQEWEKFNGKPQDLYAYSVRMRIAVGDYHGAFEQAQTNLQKFPQLLTLKSLSIELAHILGEAGVTQSLLEDSPDWQTVSEINEMTPAWGEAALEFGMEVLTANVLSRCLEIMPQNTRVKALQARLLERNGNHADAVSLIDQLLSEWRNDTSAENKQQTIGSLWLAEAAFELNQYAETMEIVRQTMEKTGKTNTTAKLFLNAMVQAAFSNWLKRKLDVEANLDPVTTEDLNCFDEICAIEEPKIRLDKEINALIGEIRFWLGREDAGADTLDSNGADTPHPYVLLATTYQKEGSQKAEILMERFRDDPNAWMIMAALELESEPAKSAAHATALLRGGQTDPLKYALLAFAKQKLGQTSDAYAAINLALTAWPEEYKWQLQAGEMSKALGDVRSSLDHFKKAANTHKNDDAQVYLGELSLKAGNPEGITYLEKKLNGSSQDFDVLLQLGELSIKNNKLQKAARYLENARSINPQDVRVHILLSKVAIAVQNFDKARELIGEAEHLLPHDKQVVLQKAAVLDKSQGSQAALDYLEHLHTAEIQQDADVIIRQAEYIREVSGAEQSLAYLLPKSFDSVNSALLLATAKNYLEMGKLDLSEEFAERALQLNPEDPQPLAMLARISGKNGDLDKAVDLLVKAIQNEPFEASYYMELANIYQSRRDMVKATETLENGLRAIPQNFELLSALGMLLYQQGQYHPAQEILQQAVSINPRDENVKRLLSTLANANIIQGNINNDTLIEKA